MPHPSPPLKSRPETQELQSRSFLSLIQERSDLAPCPVARSASVGLPSRSRPQRQLLPQPLHSLNVSSLIDWQYSFLGGDRPRSYRRQIPTLPRPVMRRRLWRVPIPSANGLPVRLARQDPREFPRLPSPLPLSQVPPPVRSSRPHWRSLASSVPVPSVWPRLLSRQCVPTLWRSAFGRAFPPLA